VAEHGTAAPSAMSTPQGRPSGTPGPSAIVAIAAALFAAVLVLKLAVRTPGFGFPLLYDIPVALLAITLGLRAGLAGAAVGMALYAIGDAAGEIHSNVAGYISRGLTFVLLGGLLGLYSDRLRRAEGRTRPLVAIVDQSEDAIVAKDTRGVITEWNRGAEHLYGYSAQETLGSPISMIIPPDRADEDAKVLSRVLEGGPPERYETVRRRKDGSGVEVWLTMSPIRDIDGTIVGASSIARDIGELKRVQRDLERSNAELEQFAYVASHDLREPLRSIDGFVKLLQRRYKGELDADGERFIGFVVAGVDRMQTLIDNLLTYSRAGRGELRSEAVDSRELVEGTLSSLDAAVREAGAEVELGELPTLTTDPLPGVPEPALQRGQVQRRAGAAGGGVRRARGRRLDLRGSRQRHRDRPGGVGAHLPDVPAPTRR
jgi:PAS domain S-box-containing protein